MRKLLLIAIAALALPACAQVFNLEGDRVQMSPLSGLVRFHTGDDPDGKLGWSEPEFDDSAWPLISSTTDWSAQGYKGYSGFAWYRFKVILPRDHRQLGLYIPSILTSYQVFADGKMVGSYGGFPPDPTVYTVRRHVVLLPAEHGGEMEIAIRVWHWPQWAMDYGGGLTGVPRIGNADTLNDWAMLRDKNTFWELTAQNCTALLCFLYCSAGFALFLMRRNEREYLWYGLLGFFFCASPLVSDYASFHDLPLLVESGLGQMLAAAGFFSFVMFTWLLLGRKGTVWVWVSAGALALDVMMWALSPLLGLPISTGNSILALVNLLMTIGPMAMLIQGVRRGNPDARLLLIPQGLNTLANWINALLFPIVAAGYSWAKPIWAFWHQTFNWPFPFGLYDLSIWIIVIAVMAILILRFARSRQEEEQLKSELDAAEVVQKLLIPEKAPEIPGFQIESAYRPARNVGGDFFYIRPDEEGGLLVVIGDVSGKGLRAAMTVNSVIGAMRTMPSLPAARILGDLNRGLVGQMQGGFVTCCAAHIDKDGKVTIANAGHLSPYIDGTELAVPAGVPLGIVTGIEYQESSFYLRPGSSLTFVSDGVVEARNAQGELFGFERAAAISTQSSEEIARAAQKFGQEDDITVLTLAFAPAEVMHA
ncbi:MAG TPA: SpoIIE family protein phosphatase [Terracidiphilus sp.]|nr:SpoIIE family protein phosphatase [Terracidiphilus sp.]